MFTITYYFFRNCFFNSFLFNWNICENMLYFVRKYFMAISIFHYNFYIVQYFWKNIILFYSKYWINFYFFSQNIDYISILRLQKILSLRNIFLVWTRFRIQFFFLKINYLLFCFQMIISLYFRLHYWMLHVVSIKRIIIHNFFADINAYAFIVGI